MTGTSHQPKRRLGLVLWMIVSQLLMLGSLVIWALMAGLSVMAFDSGVTKDAWTFVLLVWAYPIIPLILAIAAWIAFAKRKNTLAAVLSGLTFAPVALLLLAMWAQNMIWNLTGVFSFPSLA
ncbi:MAG: hypothetical protein ACOYYJ_04640 [Chloroflexota bacterium]